MHNNLFVELTILMSTEIFAISVSIVERARTHSATTHSTHTLDFNIELLFRWHRHYSNRMHTLTQCFSFHSVPFRSVVNFIFPTFCLFLSPFQYHWSSLAKIVYLRHHSAIRQLQKNASHNSSYERKEPRYAFKQ